jgi:riboflavin biosynthesis pyrimidine reductase
MLETLLETRHGKPLPLPRTLARLYGRLRMPVPASRPFVFTNFVTTLDGVVSLNIKGHASGGDISGFSATDRMVMGLLRSVSDAIVIGSGTFQVDRKQVWTAAAIYPKLAGEYRRLSESLGHRGLPLNVIVTARGNLDLRLPIFTSGKVQALVLTTAEGAKQLKKQRGSDSVDIRVIRTKGGEIPPRAILAEVCRVRPCKRILVEGGPSLIGDFYAAGLMDEQFLTLSPQIAGREFGDNKISLVMGKTFAPRNPLWGKVIDARRSGGHLFLRYAFT